MRNTLVILNYQREIPPFMQSVIHFANDVYEKIIYITPELYNDNRNACRATKLEVYQVPRSKWRWALLKSPVNMLNTDSQNQIKIARTQNVSKRALLEQLIRYSVCSEVLKKQVCELIVASKITPKETVILATWFSNEAYATAKLKKMYPDFRSISYAHSFEIDVNKNALMAYGYNQVKHEGCDRIVFISYVMRQQYFDYICTIYPQIKDYSTIVRYLGSEKAYPDKESQESVDDTLRIASCSGVIPIKRVHLIVDALSFWNGGRIEWIHIGGGPDLEELKALAEAKLSKKKKVNYSFKGTLPNKKVQEYYVENPVDLFINVSEAEGLPVSLMECMSYGIPAIATDVGGSREIITENTGFLLSKDFKPHQLTELIEEYAKFSTEQRQEYRRNARIFWNTYFNARNNAKNFLEEIRVQI
ncbi:putative teichuronic acid biosynthesis glycosyltransferase TuaC [Desulfosporosinus acididurans]|uniref:Putative teichuronic acid biosynthesis glycosyltransferase TuaC n=1 Tax=Desulfosporosinus acididurans TaxID=476652 RepID=A0A0J1FRM0_9FIRM|nr:glycosyltransferase [Desulfosporosinus acididurans]KLU66124.1 putative teichuronic acid biosynthesis glycosyltransferase TuaC [Desulfosporosinus acididurans]